MPLDTPGPTAEAAAPKPIARACCGGNCKPKPATDLSSNLQDAPSNTLSKKGCCGGGGCASRVPGTPPGPLPSHTPAPSAHNPRGCCTGSLIGEIQHAISSTSASSEVHGAAHSATATAVSAAHAEPFSSADPSSDLNSLDRFDDPAFRSAFVQDLGGDIREANLALEGVRCVQCVGIIEGLPRLARGVIEARLDMRRAVVRLRWNDAALPLSAIVRTLAGLGYTAHPLRRDEKALARKREDRGWLVRLAVAAACSGNAMLFAFAFYVGSEMDPAHKRLFEWASVLITAVSLAWPGAIFFRNAWAAITARRAHIDVPIAIALAAGGLWSAATLVRGHGEIYCDTVTVLVFALLVGRFLQHRQQRWTADSVELLFSLMPARARRVLPSGALEVIESHALTVGDLVEVRAGESFPADGDVVSGRSSVDQSFLTGESRPVSVAAADHVHAGAMNINATLRVRVLAHGDDTRVARLMRLVEESAGRRAPILAFADRAASWFVVGMLGLAAITLALWWSSGVGLAVEHAIALLVVTCPCALGIATPITLSAALGKAARRGVLIKGGDAIQKLAAPSLMLLDKTGTLTHGALSPLAWHGDSSLVAPVAAIEASATHPAALALASLSPGAQAHHDVRDLSQIVGSGITASVDGTPIAVGSWAFARSLGAHIPSDLAHLASSAAASGHTPIFIVRDAQAAALAILGDRVREDARPTLDALRAAGWRIGMISGDHPGVVGSVASQLDIPLADARAETTPEEKVRAVREAARAGTVVMVGDGVNDAAALAAADVGIAVHGGAEASLAAADIYLSQPGVGGIKSLVDACSRTMRVIRRGLYISAAYNITAGGLAMSGLMSPIVAALVMPLSSLTVTIIALRSRTFD